MLQVTPVRAFTDNYIWLIHSPRDAHAVVAVDPGDAAPVERTLAERELTLCGLLLTHHHADHRIVPGTFVLNRLVQVRVEGFTLGPELFETLFP